MEPKLFMCMGFGLSVCLIEVHFGEVGPSKLMYSAITMAQTTIAYIIETNLSFVEDQMIYN